MPVSGKPRYLFAVPSSCQMYSGTGKAIFDFVDHCIDDFDFAFIMDTLFERNYGITSKFCASRSIPLTPSEPLLLPGCVDSGIAALPAHLAAEHYDIIECVSWANAGTNLSVLDSCRNGTRIVYTPHTQPWWTLGPHYRRYFMVPGIFTEMLNRVDAVFADSHSETQMEEFRDCPPGKVHVIALGVDTKRFSPGGGPRPCEVVCVCDAREPRKRLDLLLRAFEHALTLDGRLRLTLAGMGSDHVSLPEALRDSVRGIGYVSDADLVSLYRKANLFVLMSDFEAFGLPIAEALCCGLPVLLNRAGVPADLFTDLPGVFWTENTDVEQSGALIAQLACRPPQTDIVREAVRRFSWEDTYGRKRDVALGLTRQ